MNAKDKLIYLASPYSHTDPAIQEARFRAVCLASARLMSEGNMIFSPIAHSHPIALAGKLNTSWGYWEKYDRAMIAVCAELWVLTLPGWERSCGVLAEMAIAKDFGLERVSVEPTAEELKLVEAVKGCR